ncbi:MAG: hypothetical protein B7Y76_05665 [Sphingobacteriia bacterium 35-40-5]|nr:MAG: hypothetical protein B7Y76_05665 [Sphingobacteriia bacterium 35-40-5]
MNEQFLLPLTHHGEEWNLSAEFQPRGFGYVIQVTVHNQQILFERDEENNFRAMQTNGSLSDLPKPDQVLLANIAATLQQLFS